MIAGEKKMTEHVSIEVASVVENSSISSNVPKRKYQKLNLQNEPTFHNHLLSVV